MNEWIKRIGILFFQYKCHRAIIMLEESQSFKHKTCCRSSHLDILSSFVQLSIKYDELWHILVITISFIFPNTNVSAVWCLYQIHCHDVHDLWGDPGVGYLHVMTQVRFLIQTIDW